MKANSLFLSYLFLIFSFPLRAQQSIPLSAIPQEKDGFVMSEVEPGVFEVTTTSGNVFVKLVPVEDVWPDTANIIEFEYFCASGMEFMVIAPNGVFSKIEENMIRLPIAEGWSRFSYDISQQLEQVKKTDGFLEIMIVPNAARPTTLRIQKVRLRSATEKEKEQNQIKEKQIVREAQLNKDIGQYLYSDYSGTITEVKVTEYGVEVLGHIEEGLDEIYLCEVPLYGELTDKIFLSETKVNRKQFRQKFSRFIENKEGEYYDRLYSRWVLVRKKQEEVQFYSSAHYADQVFSENRGIKEVLKGKKGIGGFSKNGFESDIDDLQISSITVNILLSFIRLTPTDGTIPFQYNGQTYYADKNMVEGWDRTLKFAAEKDLIVSAILLVPSAKSFPDIQAGQLFEHPDFNTAGIYTMPNMTTLTSVNLYAAAIDFLASRYSWPDKRYGRIHKWIVHNEVDAGWVWTNAGIKTPLRFMDIYLKSMRLVYYTARKYNPQAEVLITLTHYWQARHNDYCYPGAQLLNLLLDYTKVEGDFKWGVAYHPYPQSLFEPKSWLDDQAVFSYNTPLITFKNLEVLDAWIKHPRALYQGKEKRTLFLSEQNPNSKDYSPKSLEEQAAGMAYALKKMEYCDGIDAYQMHGWFDQRVEGGLRIGVRRFVDDETEPAGRKPAWFIFQAWGTEQEEIMFEFAKPIIGINTWEEIFYKHSISIP